MTFPASGVVYNGRYLTRQLTGVDRFANELLRAVAAESATPLQVLIPGSHRKQHISLPAANCESCFVGRLNGHLWEQLELSSRSPDRVLVNLCNTGPVSRHRQLTVIHDVAAIANPQNYSLQFRLWYRFMLNGLVRRSRAIATVSSFSRDELRRVFPGAKQQIEVISEGGEHILREPADNSVLAKLQLKPRSYVLTVGSASPNKNLKLVTRAMAQLERSGLRLVAVGGQNTTVFAEEAAPQSQVVDRTGYVTDAQLRSLYENAFCFVFASIYEGFGLPPLEAMCCGCPIIVSSSSSLPEVCADAALYCDPFDADDLGSKLKLLHGSPSLRQELVAAGLARSAMFSWKQAGAQFSEIISRRFF